MWKVSVLRTRSFWAGCTVSDCLIRVCVGLVHEHLLEKLFFFFRKVRLCILRKKTKSFSRRCSCMNPTGSATSCRRLGGADAMSIFEFS